MWFTSGAPSRSGDRNSSLRKSYLLTVAGSGIGTNPEKTHMEWLMLFKFHVCPQGKHPFQVPGAAHKILETEGRAP